MIDATATTADQLGQILDLAFNASADISVVKLGELPEASANALSLARKAADQIKTLLDEEFGPGARGGLIELIELERQ